MRESSIVIFSLLLLLISCVKEAGKVLPTNYVGTTGSAGNGTVTTGVPDPLYPEAWHLNNTGQSTFSTGRGIAGEDISVSEVISKGITGKGVKVAISDSGTDHEHEDLTNNQLTGEHRNYSTALPQFWRGSLPYFQRDDAHGTATTGLILAQGMNALGSRGVAPDAKFGAFLFIGDYTGTPSSLLARNIDQTDGDFDVFNYSYGYSQCYFNTEDELALLAFKDGVTHLRAGKGAIYVQSAGNDFVGTLGKCLGTTSTTRFAGNTNTSSDLAIPEKIVVGAVNAEGLKSSYSTPGSSLWVSAPGGEFGDTEPAMLTTDISGCAHGYSRANFYFDAFNRGSHPDNSTCNYTSLMNGTSAAAPVASGVVALMLQAKPTLSWRDVKHILALTADEVDYSLTEEIEHPLGPTYELPGHTYDMKWIKNAAGIDFSNWYGFGRVNALSAVLMATTYDFPLGTYETTSNPATEKWYYSSGTINEAIPDNDPDGTPANPQTIIKVDHNFIIESVQVELNITHGAPKDLAITLISPSNIQSRLLNVNSNLFATSFPSDLLLLTNAFYGERSAGLWRIHIVDGNIANLSGTLTNWKIKINGHKIVGDRTYPNPVTAVSLPSPYLASGPSSVSPPVSFTPSTSTDVTRYELSVGTTPGATDVTGWTSIGLRTSLVQLTQLDLTPFNDYYLNIRAIDNLENASTVVTKKWQTNL